jgi:hypothetical protein
MGWNLPPGVTDRMIDEQANGYGDEPEGPSELDLVYEELSALKAALKSIAAFDDDYANRRLRDTGSYGYFDEPGSVQVAREALAALEVKS